MNEEEDYEEALSCGAVYPVAPPPGERPIPPPSVVLRKDKNQQDFRELMRHIDPARMGGGL